MTHTTLAIGLAITLAASPAAAGDQAAYVPADRTAAAFAKGQPLIETATYKIHASRRDAPGAAEIHDADTDVIYVLEGTATVVTGGRAVGARTTAAGEQRGDSIDDGTTRRLARGDVLVVPHGVPHQFIEVAGPFLYYVVKVTAPAAAAATPAGGSGR